LAWTKRGRGCSSFSKGEGRVTATLQNTVSIFQLAFGVNAVVPALHVAFRRTQDSLATRLVRDLRKLVPTFELDEKNLERLGLVVSTTLPGLKLANRLKIIPFFMLGTAMVISFFGLVLSAVQPAFELSDGWVWVLSIYILIVCPGSYLLYHALLKGLERLWIWKWTSDPSSAVKFAEIAQMHLDHAEFMERIQGALHLAQMQSAAAAKKELRELVQRWTGRILRLVSFRSANVASTQRREGDEV
jgi:hypothetical protein